MKDNLSIVITIIVLVLLMVIFPLYNFFERQDDMSYNLVLKATTNFADQVMNNGYIDQNSYDKFVTELANTGNVYDIEIEAHRKVLTGTGNVYEEKSYIDYTNDIFNEIENTSGTSNLMKRSLKNNTYLLNQKDEIYVKVKNSNITMAGALFNAIVPTSNKTRIEINYGGIIKNNAWKDVDARYTGHNIAPGAPELKIETTSGIKNINNDTDEYYKISKNDIVNNGILAKSTAFEGRSISKYFWKITDVSDLNVSDGVQTSDSINSETKLGSIADKFLENHKYKFEVYAVDNTGYKSDSTIVNIEITNNDGESVITDIKGDMDNDSKLTDNDLVMLKEYLDNKRVFSFEEKNKADININRVVDENDYILLSELIEKGYILGDIDSDNIVTINDYNLVNMFIQNTSNLSNEDLKRADMDGNGIVDNKDLDLIKQRY